MSQGSASSVYSFSAHVLPPEQAANYTEAVAFYEAALQNQPDRYAWTGRGFALLKLGRYEEAIASYDQALAMRADETSWCHRGDALRYLGRYTEALRSYDQALALEPDFDAAFYGKAVTYVLESQDERALENLRQAIARSPQEYRQLAKLDSSFDGLRRDLRFQRLLRREL